MVNFRTIARSLALPSALATAQSIRGGYRKIDSSYDGPWDMPGSPPSQYAYDDRASDRADPRIIGGSPANSGRYRYSVSLQDRIGHFCGGSLIAPDTVLSAAHCGGGSYDVVVDRPNLNSNNSGQSIPMKREIKHPNYNSRTTNNDFLLVFLDEAVDMTDGIEVVEINSDRSKPPVGQEVTVMGYGDTNPSDFETDLSDRLMEVEVNVISNEDCDDSRGTIGGFQESYNGQITSSMLCAKKTNQDACQGDSGGPLVVKGSGNKDLQVGVVSWGIGCASRHFPGVYARISSEYNWIRKEVCARSRDPPDSFNCGGNGNGGGGGGNGGGSGGSSGRPPSPSPPSPGPGPARPPSGSGGGSGGWDGVFDEDFGRGMGFFKRKDGAKYIYSAKHRSGVVRIQRDATMDTDWHDVERYDRCRARVTFQMVGMERNDDWCVEYGADGNSKFNEARCFSPDEFNNKRWWDGEVASFSVKGMDDVKVRLRCRGNSKKDDVLIDGVRLECQ